MSISNNIPESNLLLFPISSETTNSTTASTNTTTATTTSTSNTSNVEGITYSNSNLSRLPFIQHVAHVHISSHTLTHEAISRRQSRISLDNFKLTRINTTTEFLQPNQRPIVIVNPITTSIPTLTPQLSLNSPTSTATATNLTTNISTTNAENRIRSLGLTGAGISSKIGTQNTRIQQLVSSSLDLFSMGKIQEFRDKVSVGQVKMTQKDIWRCLGAEFLGTFLLVLLGCGGLVKLEGKEEPTLLGAALSFGFIVATLAVTIGHVSCHINPAVTVAMLVTGKIHLVTAALYIVVQCLAAIAATAVLKVLTPGDTSETNFGFTHLASTLTELQGFGIEFILTFVLLFIVFAVTDENRTDFKGSGPLAIGLALSALVLYGGPLTGAGMNPARVLGPCVIMGKFDSHWLYWLGPIGGGITAAALYQGIFRGLRPDEVEAAELAMERKSREQRETPKDKDIGAVPPV